MPAAADIIRAGRPQPCQPWPRRLLTPQDWSGMSAALAEAPDLGLLALWADATHVHALFRTGRGELLPVSAPVEAGYYAALSPHRPAAALFERTVRDLWGHAAADARDLRPWLDHGVWPNQMPLASRPIPASGTPEPPEFLPAGAAHLQVLAVGPVRGCVAEPNHLRVTAHGEIVARLEARLGYAHKGILALLRGKSPRAAARFAARLSGDATVAHAIAFARAAEAASGAAASPRADALRAVMAELERIANHLGTISAVIEAAGVAALAGRFLEQREALLSAAGAAFGHRLMMDCIVPGGVVAEMQADGPRAIEQALAGLDREMPALMRRYAGHSGLAARGVGVGVVTPVQAQAGSGGGIAGRASGQHLDLRRTPSYPPYDQLAIAVPVRQEGDVDARVRVRAGEIAESAMLVRHYLATLPEGVLGVALAPVSGEAFGWAESARGDVWHWLRLEGGQITAAFLRDPAWLHWPLLEACVRGGTVADIALCEASFGIGCSAVDL